MAGVCADGSGVVADREGYRGGAKEDGSIAMGGDSVGPPGRVDGEDCRRGEERDMPPLQYRLLRWDAKLSQGDVQTLSTLGKGAGVSEAALAGDGDAVHGKAVLEKRCTGCHALEADREGPRLAGVYGRKAGSVAGFTYSTGLKNLGVTWNDATLEKWLSDPDIVVKDNNMSFSVPKAEERRDLIAFLKH